MKIPRQGNPTEAKSYTYLALGDSYTIGEKVDPGENFPNQVVFIMKSKGYNFLEPDIVARTGWTTDELQAAIKKAKLKRSYDFVTLLIGVNNQYRGRTTTDYIPEFESILKHAIQLTGSGTGHVIILSIPDWGITPFAEDRDRKKIATEIDEYNAANKRTAMKHKVHYIDITGSTREAAKDQTLLTSDRLHPSAKEYKKWAGKIAAYMQSKL